MASSLVAHLGLRRVLIAGLELFAGGLVWCARLPVHGSYLADLLGPSLLIALGLGFAFVPITILAETGVRDREYGHPYQPPRRQPSPDQPSADLRLPCRLPRSRRLRIPSRHCRGDDRHAPRQAQPGPTARATVEPQS